MGDTLKSYNRILVYYFSGTGNSKNVALWISEFVQNRGIECIIMNITNIDRINIEPPPLDALIIFVSPIHGFNYPPVMLHFIARFPKGKNKIVLMNTRAGMLIGKFITPGLTGAAFLLSSIILIIKGFTIIGLKPVDLPSNWISLHPGLNNKTIKYLHVINKERVKVFIERILDGRKSFKCFREIVQDIVVSPISLLYYFIGRFIISKTYYASNDCDKCDLCIKNCPVHAIKKVDGRPYWSFNCESCMKCMSYCPKKAIESAHGFIIGIGILYSSVVIVLLYKYLVFFRFENGFLSFCFESAIFLIMLSIAYPLFHYFLRFKIFERIIVFTSLTKNKWWGRRYRAIKS